MLCTPLHQKGTLVLLSSICIHIYRHTRPHAGVKQSHKGAVGIVCDLCVTLIQVTLASGQGGTPADGTSQREWGNSWQVTECAAGAGLVLVWRDSSWNYQLRFKHISVQVQLILHFPRFCWNISYVLTTSAVLSEAWVSWSLWNCTVILYNFHWYLDSDISSSRPLD